MANQLELLNARIADVADLRHAADLIEWDERVYMPAGGADTHGEMSATLRRLGHEHFTSPEVGALLEDLSSAAAGRDPDSPEARLIAVTARDYRKATRVPAAFVAEHALAVSAAQNAWVEARAASNFAAFRPHLERIVDLKRQYVAFFPPAAHPYDVLLDDFEPGMTTADVQQVFATLRPAQVDLIRSLAARPPIDDACLRVPYSERDIWDFAVQV
ncbi:MAG TPA: hypothetical protein VG871_21725, partial [Vicinamibacterales bacterium]|nr:hypothetical protein [Vicinamibacterales bacterium]